MEKQYFEIVLNAKKRIGVSDTLSASDRLKTLFNLFTQVTEDITSVDRIVFTTLFARVAYIGQKYGIESQDLLLLHRFRRANESRHFDIELSMYILLGDYLIDLLLHHYTESDRPILPQELTALIKNTESVQAFRSVIEAVVFGIDIKRKTISFLDEKDGSKVLMAKWDVTGKNELFTEVIQKAHIYFEPPFELNLLDVEIFDDGVCVPQGFVFLPDYLVDVTSIASCFQDYGAESLLSILNLYKSKDVRGIPLLIGNIANMLLDELVTDPTVSFEALLPKIFELDAVTLSIYEDAEVKDIVAQSRRHFTNLKSAIKKEFEAVGIKRDRVYLEPSFYSRKFGLQGRLDVLHHDEEQEQLDIVELKSGSPYKTNKYGLNSNHYIQTLLYDLLIKSTFGYKVKPSNYILYSKVDTRSLRYAPSVRVQQYEAMKVRNELILLEQIMAYRPEVFFNILKYLHCDNFEKIKGYTQTDLKSFSTRLRKMSEIELAYFLEFTSFVKREQFLAKTGVHGLDNSNGLAAIWLENEQEKEDRFALLKKLKIEKNDSQKSIPILTLSYTPETSALAKFRVGDIAVLYPHQNTHQAVLREQIFKCSIVDISPNQVCVKLRSRQCNHAIFHRYQYWNIEEDILDSSFTKSYRSIYDFMNAKKIKRELLLGLKAPKQTVQGCDVSSYKELTEEQRYLLSEMLVADDYYLLWGPPGTGKTSIMIKTYVQHIMATTDEYILLLAYTNRAVDELCDAIRSISDQYSDRYIRVGSSTACAPLHKGRILDRVISGMKTRSEIKQELQSTRIFVGTVSSMINKPELFELIQFGTTIIDEASQILEPTIVGLLSRVDKFILVGDHRQLPAIVQQDGSTRQTRSEALHSIGIMDMSVSFFERLYRQCMDKGWTKTYGQLTFQGRMHTELMAFPGDKFYGSQLNILPDLSRLSMKKWKRLSGCKNVPVSRLTFIDTPINEGLNFKTNLEEANVVAHLLGEYTMIYGADLKPNSMGVITPYRAQIALIKQRCIAMDVDISMITIDTVERYQGGARGLIILSMCVNKEKQFKSLMSVSTEGIDRKLNVALTRAKEQIVLIGNEALLRTQSTFSELIDTYTPWSI